ncbi:sensor histidine kinase [Mongoliitalea daihaiensis]|uniref:sensor histidine kinase n=1 Tax=Mongoliitalea daihaiensis TaxID=2782006 RepID=UPI001F1D6681|nr:HAMP domain-containing sensor histidine kinase [Mongoliitalea daihaiensis]UJP66386.1 HAMP domain-containing histidine kinase [Mongoliitalea daihaiensis]
MTSIKQEAGNLRIFQVQKKLIIKLAFFSAVLVLAFGFFNLLIGNIVPAVVFFSFLPLFIWSYYLLKQDKNTFSVVNGLIVMNLSILILNFFTNGGYTGPTNYGFFIMTFVLTLVFSGWLKYAWLAVLLLTHFVIMYLDIFDLKEVTNGYDDATSLFIDHIGAFWGCAIFVFVMNDLFTRNYVQQSILLENASLELDSKMTVLEEVNLGKSKLLGILAHDLRGPIKSTGQIIELVKNNALNQQEQELIFQKLEQQYKEIDQTLNATLEFVLAELGSDKSHKTIDASSPVFLIESLVSAFSVRLTEKNIEVKVSTEGIDSSEELILEMNELEVIIRNLLDNSIKYSPVAGKIFIRLIKTNQTIRWEIQDQGNGMDAETGSKLFQFKVVSMAGTSDEKGVGLGMYLCKSLADKIGAKLSFTSAPGKGTTFVLEKPLIQ